MFNEYLKKTLVKIPGYIFAPSFSGSDPIGFFDGASQLGHCGSGMVIRVSGNHSFHLWMGYGEGTNTRTGLLALWGLLLFA